MPIIKRQRKRATAGRRRMGRKRTMNISRPRMTRRIVPSVSVKRTVYLGQISPNTTTINGYWQYRTVSLDTGFTNQTGASMGGLTNIAEYEALFDQYKLSAFKITLRPKVNDLQATQDVPGATSFRDVPYVSIVKDPTDRTTPSGTYNSTALNAFLELGRAKTYRGDRKVDIYMKPLVAEQYGGGAERYVKPQWTDLNTAGKAMPHRGYHLFFHTQNLIAAAFIQYDVFVTYYLQFRGMK